LSSQLNTTNNNLQNLKTDLSGNLYNFALNSELTTTNNNLNNLKSDLSGNVYNFALNSQLQTTNNNLQTLKSDLSGNLYDYALNSSLNNLKSDLSGNVYQYALNADLQTTNNNLNSLKTDLSGNVYNYALNSELNTTNNNLNSLKTDLSGNVYNYALNSDLLTTNSNVSTNTTNIATLNTNLTTTNANVLTNTNNISTLNNSVTSLQSSKADKANPTFTGTATFNSITTQALTDNGNITIKGNTIIGDQTTDTLTVTGTSTFNNNVIVQTVNVKNKFDALDASITSLTSTKANDNAVVKLTGNQTINDIKTFNIAPKIGLNDIATQSYVDTQISNLIAGAPSTLDTLNEIATVLQNNQNDVNSILSSMVTLSTNQTISGVKTFTSNPQVNTLTQGNNSNSVASTSYVDTGLATKANSADLSNYLTTSNATSTYQPISGMSSYLTTSNASSTYQTISGMSSYPQLTTSNTFSNLNEFSSDIVQNKLCEKYVSGTVSSNALSINYSSNTNNIYAISPSSATNIALTITNIPNRGNCIYDFTFLINTSSNKQYINTLNVNGSSITMKAGGGLANIVVNPSATMVVQNIYIQMNGTTVTNAFTSVVSFF
jgi:hypothetical protein